MTDAPAPLRVRGLHHVAWAVMDAKEAADFYCEAKGFHRIPRPDLGFPGEWVQNARLVFHFLEAGPQPQPYFNLWFTEENPVLSFGVHDAFAAAAFYTKVLGLAIVPKEDVDRAGLPGYPGELPVTALVVATGLSIYLIGSGPKRTPSEPNSRGNHVAFGVEDIDAAERWLKYCGVTYLRKTQRGSGIEQIFLVAPDGHTLELNPSPMP